MSAAPAPTPIQPGESLRVGTAVLLAGLLWGAVAGAAQAGQVGPTFVHFGADAIALRFVALAVTRTVGPHLALVATGLAATVLLHRRGAPPVRRYAVMLGAAVPLVYAPVCAAALLGAVGVLRRVGAALEVGPGLVVPGDVAFGLLAALARGVALAAAWPLWCRFVVTPGALMGKIVGMVIGLVGLSAAVALVGALVGAVVGALG